jgi:hypothetical protein
VTSSPKISPHALKGLLLGHDQAGAFVAAGDEHEHEVRGLRVKRDVANLVADQQRDALQPGELVIEAALALGVGERGDPFGRRLEDDALSGEARADPQGHGQMSFPGAGRAQQHDVLLAGQEVQLGEVQHRVATQAALEGEVELLDRLARREPGGLDPCLAAVAVAAIDLRLQERRRELLIAPLLLAGAVGELGQRPGRRRRLQRPEQMREFGRRAAHAINAS